MTSYSQQFAVRFGREGLPSSRRHRLNVPRPLTPGSPSQLHFHDLHRFHGLHSFNHTGPSGWGRSPIFGISSGGQGRAGASVSSEGADRQRGGVGLGRRQRSEQSCGIPGWPTAQKNAGL